jgi:hypothetical protein
MANEFKIKRGFLSEGNGTITGSLTVTQGVTGSLQGTASFAISSSTAVSASFSQTASYAFTALTASYALNGGGGGSGLTSPIIIAWDGQGGFLSTGFTRYFVSPYNCTITGWSIISEGTNPTCTIDIWKTLYGTSLPTSANSITGSFSPSLSTGNVIRSSTLTGWTTAIAAGDILAFNIDAVANALTIKINLELQ